MYTLVELGPELVATTGYAAIVSFLALYGGHNS
jgi:hypothetical protein